ncbi:hypothetical protein FB45DRAFT_499665 [Roridomyces roridus]|uniref:Transcription activator of gluconeogenesis ERT1 n=1 Tax=Roridomyces roridus TaxID=1738132 RepID=A0AAD7BVV3_9AGAR|nr:hypothetical protein FB45DRAFT_499665 [Roridomyces roridus]
MVSTTESADDGANDQGESRSENRSPALSATAGPVHIYPITGNTHGSRSKRRQVKNACTSCQKASKKCDDARPCLRCVKYGVHDECVDSPRKERKKGAKRGPYRKRDGAEMRGIQDTPTSPSQETEISLTLPPMEPLPLVAPGYTPGFYTRFPVPCGKREEPYPPPFYLAPAAPSASDASSPSAALMDAPASYPLYDQMTPGR